MENGEDLLEVCEGTLTKPATGSNGYEAALRKFKKADKAAWKLIVTTVEIKPSELPLNCTSAKDMWDKSNAVYDMKSDENLSLIKKQFFEFK